MEFLECGKKAKFDDRHSFLGDTGPFMDNEFRLTTNISTKTEKTKKLLDIKALSSTNIPINHHA